MRQGVKVVVSLTVVGLMTFSGLALAAREGHGDRGKAAFSKHREHGGKMFLRRLATMDTNNDKQVSRDEFSTAMMKRFETVDANHDGNVTPDEIANAVKEHAQTVFSRLDKNGDGKLGKDEFPGKPERFAALDTSGDGFVTKEELKAASKKARERFSQIKPGKRLWEKVDTNKDGKVSREEYTAAVTRIFEFLDRNEDGVLSEADHQARSSGDTKEDGSARSRGSGTLPALP